MEHSTAIVSLVDEELIHECQQLQLTLPKEDFGGHPLYKYQGFWYPHYVIQPVISFQRHFQAQDTDIILVSKPKTGTTWLKSLVFAVTNRTLYGNFSHNHPLLTSNPHQLVPFFELALYAEKSCPDFTKMATRPRLFATHVSYFSLPESIKNSGCRIVYICRNPFDTLVSTFHFLSFMPGTAEILSIEELFDRVCDGVEHYGPFLEHALEYWKQSLERPEKVLFLKYEDLKQDIVSQLKKLATFLGVPFSAEEENDGVVEEISKLCSFENLKDLEINKTGESKSPIFTKYKHNVFFRKGQVGDWVNYFTPSMVERFDKLIQNKLGSTGLTFKVSL